jgi:hypothetical protein
MKHLIPLLVLTALFTGARTNAQPFTLTGHVVAAAPPAADSFKSPAPSASRKPARV